MRETLDTFLHFLADNLTGISVHSVRTDPDDPSAALLQMNTVNVKLIKPSFDWHISLLQVSIDVVNDDELTALDWSTQVWNLLSAAYYTPKYNYSPVSSGGQPVAMGTNVFWKTSANFRQVKSDFYTHYSCALSLHHTN